MKESEFYEIVRNIKPEERLYYSRLKPEHVFALSDFQKVRFFYSLWVKHRLQNEASKEVTRLLGPSTDTGILTLFGPTGSGKTALAEALGLQLRTTDPAQRPFVSVSIPAFGNKNVSWAGFFRSILEAAGEPMIENKRLWTLTDGHLRGSSGARASLPALRNAAISMLKNRNTRLLALDEILHILRYGNYDGTMDTLKSFSDAVSCQLLLIGPYELFNMVRSYGQVVRRGDMTYLGFYRSNRPAAKEANESDVAEYQAIIKALLKRWPLHTWPNLEPFAADLLDATLGVVGLLKEFMTRCLFLQIESGGKWENGFISKALKKSHSIDVIRKEIEQGELMLKDAHFNEPVIKPARLKEIEEQAARGIP